MKNMVSNESLDFSNVHASVKSENLAKQIKSKTVKSIKAAPQFELNNLGGPLEEDFKTLS